MKKLVIGLLIISAQSFAQERAAEGIEFGSKFTLQSKILNESRTYWVRLPASYNNPSYDKQSYPVMYVLDGKSAFFPLLGVVSFMSEKESVNFQIPEMIVVGVDTENRLKDLTPNPSTRMPDGEEAKTESQKLMMAGGGGGEAFFKFLTEELFPKIEGDYRTLPYRIYVGHSLGGLTTAYTLLKHPGIFNSYFSIDGSLWWDNGKYVRNATIDLQNMKPKTIQRFYISVIDSTQSGIGNKFHARCIHQFAKVLKDNGPANVQSKLDVIKDTDHSSIPLLSWYNGLQYIFEGYDVSHYSFTANPQLIESHYANLEKTIGLKMPPPQDVIEIVLHYLTAPNRYPNKEKAMQVVKIGLKYYPQAPFILEKQKELENSK
ncbi:MAG: alpha/beta hydrolase [Bacteroidota bacterium]|jgi:predicted alpha/beta superfamily hydrolase|nr:alpha/beta hydrolase [Cytophagales bacterium]MCZ8070671.1 alpha/beta hydrolase-fold protein [Cytophagales bacterium]